MMLDSILLAILMFYFSGAIGISDVQKPEYGNATEFYDDDVAVFWPCGVTGLQAVISASKIFSSCYYTH